MASCPVTDFFIWYIMIIIIILIIIIIYGPSSILDPTLHIPSAVNHQGHFLPSLESSKAPLYLITTTVTSSLLVAFVLLAVSKILFSFVSTFFF